MIPEQKDAAGEWITLEEAAQLAGVTVRSIRRYIARHRLECLDQHALAADPAGASIRRRLVRREEVLALGEPQAALERVRGQEEGLVRLDKALAELIRRVKEWEEKDAKRDGVMDTLVREVKGAADTAVRADRQMSAVRVDVSRHRSGIITACGIGAVALCGVVIMAYLLRVEREARTETRTELSASVRALEGAHKADQEALRGAQADLLAVLGEIAALKAAQAVPSPTPPAEIRPAPTPAAVPMEAPRKWWPW